MPPFLNSDARQERSFGVSFCCGRFAELCQICRLLPQMLPREEKPRECGASLIKEETVQKLMRDRAKIEAHNRPRPY